MTNSFKNLAILDIAQAGQKTATRNRSIMSTAFGGSTLNKPLIYMKEQKRNDIRG